MAEAALKGGFENPPIDSARAFRRITNAMARPGKIETLVGATPPPPMSVAAGTVLLTLCDPDTSLALLETLNNQEIRDWVTFHTGAPIVSAQKADFVFGAWNNVLPFQTYKTGDAQYPDRSATLVIEWEQLKNRGAHLQGPGIKDIAFLNLPSVQPFVENAAQFPLGIDFLFCSDDQIAGLPRSTKVSESS